LNAHDALLIHRVYGHRLIAAPFSDVRAGKSATLFHLAESGGLPLMHPQAKKRFSHIQAKKPGRENDRVIAV
jgi:hypothetical protein